MSYPKLKNMPAPSLSRRRPPALIFLTVATALLCCPGQLSSLKLCPPCGNTTVPYPFSTSSSCGDQDYKIQCDGTTLNFPTSNNSYPITSISPSIQRFIISPSPFLPNTCVTSDISSVGVELNATAPFNITGSNTIMFLNCTESLLRSPLNCSSNSLCHEYINSTREAAACVNAPICCTFRAGGSTTSYAIRVRDVGCRAYRSFVNLDETKPASQWGSPGVEIQWVTPQEPVCVTQTDCDGVPGNATCMADTSSPGVSRCFCNPGLFWDSVNGLCTKNVTCQDPGGCQGSNKGPLIAGLTSGIGVALLLACLGFFLYRRERRKREARERLMREREEILNSGGGRGAKLFTGREIKRATNGFSPDRLLGVGGFGEVYKGELEDGTVVAVKCAKVGNAKGTDQVLNEVRILCQVNHRSLVHLLGCCVELDQPLLVYEYIANGTLHDHLHGKRYGAHLSWAHRLGIAHQTAEGLAYLHSSAVPPIYHRDVKSSNILLDHKINAKVSDFGLSRLAETDMSHISTCAQGTLGYLDPEYYRNYQLTDKSDVYSFGVVLLELLTSHKAIDFNRDADDVNLAVYVKRMADEERIMEVIDPDIKEKANPIELDTMKALGFLALGCLEERRQNRPGMKEVTEEIEYIISIATKKDTSS